MERTEGERVSDLNLFLIGNVVILLLTIIGLLDSDYIWGIFPAIGGIIGLFFTLAVLSDGSLTEYAGGLLQTIASASTTTTNAWTFISLIPMMFTLSAFLIAGYKVSKAF